MDKIRKIIREQVERLIINEIDDTIRTSYYSKSSERKPFNEELMKKAIIEGMEVGLLFKSDNEDYKMPVSKYRIIWPVAMGTTKKGNLAIRGYHIIGQSEIEAIKTGIRSAEVEGEWRLFNTKNIKGMWFTGGIIGDLPSDYNPSDKNLNGIVASYNKSRAKNFQKQQVSNIDDTKKEG